MRSIRTLLIGRLMGGGVLLFGIGGWALQWSVVRALRAEFDETLIVSSQSLRAFVEERNGRVRMEGDVDEMPDYRSEHGPSIFILSDAQGKEIKRSPSLRDFHINAALPETGHQLFFDQALPDGRPVRCLAIGFAPEEEGEEHSVTQPLIMISGRDRSRLDATTDSIRQILFISMAGALGLLVALLWWGVRRGLRPLDRLVAGLSDIDAGTLATRLPEDPLPSELKPIAGRLNDLLDRLEHAFQKEQRFTGNVAHELRTPLAELLTLAEVNLMVAPASPEEISAGWIEVKTIASRMESLSSRLLELARAERRGDGIKLQPVVLAPLIETAWKRFASVAEERAITLDLGVDPAAVAMTDPVLLDLIVSNLIGNAVQHASFQSVLEIEWDGHDLLFTNRTENLDANDLEYVFERFWKKDAARSDGRRHGLGLSLARELAGLLGGSLGVRIPTPGWVSFVVSLRSR